MMSAINHQPVFLLDFILIDFDLGNYLDCMEVLYKGLLIKRYEIND